MTAERPRLSVTLDRDLRRHLRLVARKRGKSLSATAAELLRDALDHDEDLFVACVAKGISGRSTAR